MIEDNIPQLNEDFNKWPKIERLKRYQELGWHLFPIRPKDKRPYLTGGTTAASNDWQQIQEWNNKYPVAKWAVYGKNGWLFVDLDVRDGINGLERWAAFEDTYGSTPTLGMKSPHGGRLALTTPLDFIVQSVDNKLGEDSAPGVEIKGYNKYAIIDGPGYQWLAEPSLDAVSEAPSWLLERINGETKTELREPKDISTPALQGSRHDALISALGSLSWRLSDDALIATALTLDKQINDPPLEADEVINNVIPQAIKYAEERRNKYNNSQEINQSKIITAEDLHNMPPPEYFWLFDNHLRHGAVNGIVGDVGSGKSWDNLELAIANATGGSWRGVPCNKTGNVMLWDVDNPLEEIQSRFEARYRALGIAPPNNLFINTNYIRLDLPDGFDLMREVIEEYEPTLLILEVLAAFCGGKNMNQQENARPVMDGFKQICNDYGVTLSISHHVNKPNTQGPPKRIIDRVSGSNQIIGAFDTCYIFLTSGLGSNVKRTIHNAKMRSGLEHDAVDMAIINDRDDPEGVILEYTDAELDTSTQALDEMIRFIGSEPDERFTRKELLEKVKEAEINISKSTLKRGVWDALAACPDIFCDMSGKAYTYQSKLGPSVQSGSEQVNPIKHNT